MRPRLRKLLRIAWKDVIEKDYDRRRINSERSLQAAFWARLNSTLSDENSRLFLEPRFSFRDGRDKQSKLPDVVVCNTRSVIAVIELKYEPRKAPSLKKDLQTLSVLATHGNALALRSERYLGDRIDSRRYPLNERTLFVWAGVYRSPHPDRIDPVEIDYPETLRGRFYSLHAVTSVGSPAMTFGI